MVLDQQVLKLFHIPDNEHIDVIEKISLRFQNVLKICKFCYIAFVTEKRDGKFCSIRCSTSFYNQKRYQVGVSVLNSQNEVGTISTRECIECGKQYNVTHETQKFCCRGCALKNYVKTHPNHQKEASLMSKLSGSQKTAAQGNLKFRIENPDEYEKSRLKAAKTTKERLGDDWFSIQGKKGGSEGGRRTNELHPEICSNMGKRYGSSNGRINGKISGRKAVESGQIFSAPSGTFVWHEPTDLLTERHYHRSKKEMVKCIKLQSRYPKDYIHPNVHLAWRTSNAIEIDWVISDPSVFNDKDPSTWIKVIEFHPFDYKTKAKDTMTLNLYKENRISKLHSLGVLCDIEVLTH